MMTRTSEPRTSIPPRPACTYALKPSLEDLRRGSFHCPECGLVFQVDPALSKKWTELLLSALTAKTPTGATP
jgi:hypothetical protein